MESDGSAPEGARPATPAGFYLPELDILRFFAFFAVFVNHVPPGAMFFYFQIGAVGSLGVAGGCGVDLFFALSGYLITRLLLKERETTGGINLRAFYVRRILRIWPLYFFYIAVVFLVLLFPPSSRSIPPFGPITVPTDPMSLIFLGCFLLSFSPGVLSTSLVTHLWSISVEEQFYLVWSLTIRKISERRMIVAPIVMLVIATIARFVFFHRGFGVPMWTNSFTRLDSMAVGILVAVLPPINLRFGGRALLVVIGIVSWFSAMYYCEIPSEASLLKVTTGYPLIALGSGAFLVAGLGAWRKSAGSRIGRALIYLGKISYGLYVWNPVAVFGFQLFMRRVALRLWVTQGWPPWTEWPVYISLAFGANVALAAASYRWLEAPFLRLKSRFTYVESRPV